ncbi:MAG: diguanylate cyclase [Gammaproteobacteria bacterium]|nr:diguanylate cyclase [Gammaproteobacteria bacterium]
MNEAIPTRSPTEQHIARLRFAMLSAYLAAFVLLAASAAYSLVFVGAAHEQMRSVLARHEQKSQLLTDTQIASFKHAENVMMLVLESDPFNQDAYFMAHLRTGFDVGAGRNAIRELLEDPREQAVMAEQDAIIAEAVDLHAQVADLARGGATDAARAIFTDELTELHERGHATFQALRQLELNHAEKAIAAANEGLRHAWKSSLGAVLASFLVSLGIGAVLYRASDRISASLRDDVGSLRRLATHDHLTGLSNRGAVIEHIEQQIRHKRRFALLFMDLDGFKDINDRFGHETGDRFLVMAANRIRGCMRGIDYVARIGGDEFVALLRDIGNPGEAEFAARHVIKVFEQPFTDTATSARIGISIGAALSPAHGHTAEQLLKAADNAMYAAKRLGGGRFRLAAGNTAEAFG